MDVRNGKDITFKYSSTGEIWTPLNTQPVNGDYLPPWDRAVRAGVVVKGKGVGAFDAFTLMQE